MHASASSSALASDRYRQRTGPDALALMLPQACEAGGGVQLPGFGPMAADNGQSLLEAGCRRRVTERAVAHRLGDGSMVRYGRKGKRGQPCTGHSTPERIPSSVLSFCKKGDMMPIEAPRGTLS